MSVIEFKMGDLTFSKKPTVNDVMYVYDALGKAAKFTEEQSMVDVMMVDYDLLVDLFGDKGLTKEEMLNQPASFYLEVGPQVKKITEIILGQEENGDEKTPKKSNKSATSKKRTTKTNN